MLRPELLRNWRATTSCRCCCTIFDILKRAVRWPTLRPCGSLRGACPVRRVHRGLKRSLGSLRPGSSPQLSSAQIIACATAGATTGNASISELIAFRGSRSDLVTALENRGGHSSVRIGGDRNKKKYIFELPGPCPFEWYRCCCFDLLSLKVDFFRGHFPYKMRSLAFEDQ